MLLGNLRSLFDECFNLVFRKIALFIPVRLRPIRSWLKLVVPITVISVPLWSENRVLVVVLGETRAHELSFESIKRNLIDELKADLALCIGVKDNYDCRNPFWDLAKYRFTWGENNDYSELFDDAWNKIISNNDLDYKEVLPWREYLKIPDQFMGGCLDPYYQHPGSAGILIYARWFLQEKIRESEILDKYDWFVITRSDFIHLVPHINISALSDECIYFPDGEGYGGLTDRQVVVSKKRLMNYLDLFEKMTLDGIRYFRDLQTVQPVNLEKLIYFHLKREGLLDQVRLLPYVMYTVRPVDGSTRWSSGVWSHEHNCYIKYPSEYRVAQSFRNEYEALDENTHEFYWRHPPKALSVEERTSQKVRANRGPRRVVNPARTRR